MAPPLTHDRQIHLLDSLAKLAEDWKNDKAYTSEVQLSLVAAATIAARRWKVGEKSVSAKEKRDISVKERTVQERDELVLQYNREEVVHYADIMQMYWEPRKAGTMVASLWNEGNVHVSVGDFVEVRSPGKLKHNYLLYVVDLHSNGLKEGACSGFWVYRAGDVRQLPSSSSFRAAHAKEVLLSNEAALIDLECVLRKVEILPSVLSNAETEFTYHRFIKTEEVCIRDIDFHVPDNAGRLLQILARERVPRDTTTLGRMCTTRLKGYVTGKQQPKCGKRSKVIMPLTLQDLFSLLPTIPKDVVWKEGPIIGIVVHCSEDLGEVLGKGWESVSVPARASQVQGERITYEFLFPCTVQVHVHAPERSCFLFQGLRLFNGAGVEQWDTTRQAPRKRNKIARLASPAREGGSGRDTLLHEGIQSRQSISTDNCLYDVVFATYVSGIHEA